jgi:hypothetical protein
VAKCLLCKGIQLVYCDCTDGPPWPTTIQIHTNLLNRYYLCRRCSSVREHVCRPDGTIVEAHYHDLDSAELPAAVVEQARDILTQPNYRQGLLL